VTDSDSEGTKPAAEQGSIALQHLSGRRAGSIEEFQHPRVSIGRGRGNDCAFDAETERSVSHRHCEIRIEDGIPVLHDIGSLNGTYVNGRRVRRVPLADGDELGLGREGPRMRFARDPELLAQEKVPTPVPSRRKSGRGSQFVGGTAEERMVGGMTSMTGRNPRGRRVITAVVFVALVSVISIGAIVLNRLLERIEDLEGKKEGTSASESTTQHGDATTRPPQPTPGAVPEGPRGRVVRLLGVVRDKNQRLVDQQSLGFGAIIRADGVATTHDVFLRVRRWLGRGAIDNRHEKVLMAAPGGALANAIPVESYVLHEKAGSQDDGNAVLLFLDRQQGAARTSTAVPKQGDVRFFPPWEAAQQVQVVRLTNAAKDRVREADATLMGFSLDRDQAPPPAGMPLFVDGELVGLSLGRDLSGWAITSRQLKELVQRAQVATPELIHSSGR